VELKQTETSQNEYQQGKKKYQSEQNKVKQSETNRVKTKKVGERWLESCYYS
jgi:hypothetical protein